MDCSVLIRKGLCFELGLVLHLVHLFLFFNLFICLLCCFLRLQGLLFTEFRPGLVMN